MQQKFFSKKKKEKDMEMLNFEKKCGKLPIDKCKKNLFNERKKFCEIQKIVKNFNHVLRNNAYHDNYINVIKKFFQLPPASFWSPFNTKWRLFFRKFSKNLKSFNFVLISCAYYDNYKRHNFEIDLAPYLYKPFILRYGRYFFSKKIKSVNLILSYTWHPDGMFLYVIRDVNPCCGAHTFYTLHDEHHSLSKPIQIPIQWPKKNFLNVSVFFRSFVYTDSTYVRRNGYLCFLNKNLDVRLRKKPRLFLAKIFSDLLEFQRKKIQNINDLLTITRYHWNCHINKFLKILHGVQSPVPRRKRTPVSMFKKSIYIINVFINHSTDALHAPSINKIGDCLYTTTFKKELLVLFFNLLKKYFISPRFIKFV